VIDNETGDLRAVICAGARLRRRIFSDWFRFSIPNGLAGNLTEARAIAAGTKIVRSGDKGTTGLKRLPRFRAAQSLGAAEKICTAASAVAAKLNAVINGDAPDRWYRPSPIT